MDSGFDVLFFIVFMVLFFSHWQCLPGSKLNTVYRTGMAVVKKQK